MTVSAERIAGGFLPVAAADLVAAWRACQERPLGIGGFRAWLACREMTARRRCVGADRQPNYDVAELARLLGVSLRTARTSVGHLVAAGLVEWSADRISFLTATAPPDEVLADSIGGGQSVVTIPRRLLRWMARGGRPALIAVALSALLRCVSRRRGGFDGRGRFKSSWVARVFGVAERHARSARAELVRLGWLELDPTDAAGQVAWNRWGRAFRVHLDWRAPRGDRPTLPPGPGARSSPPDLQPGSSTERKRNPEPAPGGLAGACAENGRKPSRTSEPLVNRTAEPTLIEIPVWDSTTRRFVVRMLPVEPPSSPGQLAPRPNDEKSMPPTVAASAGVIRDQGRLSTSTIPDPIRNAGGPLRPPRLDAIRLADLGETGRVLALFDQAVRSGRVVRSEADRFRFVAAVEHALAVGRQNPCGLLARIVAKGWWHLLTQADEDRATRRLRDYNRPAPATPLAVRPRPTPPTASPLVSNVAQPGPPVAARLRSPHGDERPTQEPSPLADLLLRLSVQGNGGSQ